MENFLVPEKQLLQYKFQVVYRFHTISMLVEPLLLSLFLFLAFTTYIISGRFVLRIARKEEKQKLEKEENDFALVASAMDSVQTLFDTFDVVLKKAKTYPKHLFDEIMKEKKPCIEEKLLKTIVDEQLGQYSQKDRLAKLPELIKQYVVVQFKHVEAAEKGAEKGEADRVTALKQQADELEGCIAETLRCLGEGKVE